MRGRRFFVFEIGTVTFGTQDQLIHVSTRPTFPQQKLRSPLSLREAKDGANGPHGLTHCWLTHCVLTHFGLTIALDCSDC